jgi:1-acyl-sn-glycerol-3-phosphate acyltransferase
MIWSRLTCLLALCPVKVRGRENIIKGQPYVFVANHQSAFDIFLIYGFLGVPIKWMMKMSLAKIPFVGYACRAAGFIFVDSSTAKSAAKSVRQAEQATSGGACMCIFPEGSRTKDGRMERFRKGAFRIAVDCKLPIVPITLNGPFNVLPIGTLNLHAHKMEMVIHPPISTADEENSHNLLEKLSDESRRVIASGLWDVYRS